MYMNILESDIDVVYTCDGQPVKIERRIIEVGIYKKTRILETIIFRPDTNDIVVSQITLGAD